MFRHSRIWRIAPFGLAYPVRRFHRNKPRRQILGTEKGADKGVDGRLFFHEGDTSKTKQLVFSVKAGQTGPAHLRDLAHVVDREKAAIGVLITMHKVAKAMRTAAAEAGFYESTWGQKKHPKVQILTIEELLKGKIIDAPPMRQVVTFKKAPKVKRGKDTHPPEMFDDEVSLDEDSEDAG